VLSPAATVTAPLGAVEGPLNRLVLPQILAGGVVGAPSAFAFCLTKFNAVATANNVASKKIRDDLKDLIVFCFFKFFFLNKVLFISISNCLKVLYT
jgi:hypothetical protein